MSHSRFHAAARRLQTLADALEQHQAGWPAEEVEVWRLHLRDRAGELGRAADAPASRRSTDED